MTTSWPSNLTLRRAGLLAAALLFALQPVAALRAQQNTSVLVGTVVAGETGEPVQEGIVEVLELGLRTQTDALGRFRLEGLSPGRVQIRLRRLGFRPAVVTLEILDPGEHELGAIALVSDPLVLEGVVVEGDEVVPKLDQMGFYTRKEEAFGQFVEQEQIEMWTPRVATDVLRHLVGIRVVRNPNYGGELPPQRTTFGYIVGPSPGKDLRRWIIYSPRATGGANCPMLIFLDGLYVGDARHVDVDSYVAATQLEAVEYYAGNARIPAAFNRTGAACGVLVFWNKAGQ